MLKNFLVAAAIVTISPVLVFADDFFFAFETGANTSTATTSDGTGSISIYSDRNFAFDAADLDFTVSDPSVIQFIDTDTVIGNGTVSDSPPDTGGDSFNPFINAGVVSNFRFDSAALKRDALLQLDANGDPLRDQNGDVIPLLDQNGNIIRSTTDGNLLLVNVTEFGIFPLLATVDPLFDEDVGPNGAFELARLDYNIIGAGIVDFNLSIGDKGVVEILGSDEDDTRLLEPTLSSASLTVGLAVPEPSSAALLILGSVGFVARRRRA